MKTALCLTVLSLAACGVGCDTNRVVEPIPTSPAPVTDTVPTTATDRAADVDINIDADRPLVEQRNERRLDRRENLRDAIDKVDVDVGPAGVDVDVK